MVKVAPAHSSPHGHPPEEACSPARGCPLEDPSPRGCRAEAAPVPAGSRRFPPPLPVQEGLGVERSTFLEYRTCRRSPPPSPTPPSRSARTPHSALVRVACRPSAVRQHGQSAPPPRQCPSPAPVPPQGAPGSCGWRGAPGSGRHTGRPTTASGARASHLQSRPLPRLGTTQCQLRRLAPTLTLTLTLALAPTLTLTLTPNPNPGPDPDTDPDH